MERRYFKTYEDLINGLCGKNLSSKVTETICNYAWMCPSGFNRFGRTARLAEIKAPGIVLKNELHLMEERFKEAGFARNEIAKLKRILFTEYPDFQKKIRYVKLPKENSTGKV
jgi:hypothetical protein